MSTRSPAPVFRRNRGDPLLARQSGGGGIPPPRKKRKGGQGVTLPGSDSPQPYFCRVDAGISRGIFVVGCRNCRFLKCGGGFLEGRRGRGYPLVARTYGRGVIPCLPGKRVGGIPPPRKKRKGDQGVTLPGSDSPPALFLQGRRWHFAWNLRCEMQDLQVLKKCSGGLLEGRRGEGGTPLLPGHMGGG